LKTSKFQRRWSRASGSTKRKVERIVQQWQLRPPPSRDWLTYTGENDRIPEKARADV